MNQTFVTLTVYLAACSLAVAQSLSAPEAADVGRLSTNEVGKFEFKVKNDSGEVIEITDIKTSCSCTNVELQGSDTLAAGENRTVTGNVNFGSKIGRYETKALITYKWKNGKSEEKIVPIQGEVVAAMVLDKPRIDFGSVDTGADPQVVVINATRGNSGEQWNTIELKPGSDSLQTQVEPIGDNVRITIKFNPKGLSLSAFRANIKLRLFDHGNPLTDTFELPITAQITGPLTAMPRSVYLGAISPGQSVSRSITIRSSILDLRELKFEWHSSQIQARLQWPDNESATVIADITPTNLRRPSPIAENIILIHSSSGTRIKIPIVGIVKTSD